jgi:hypothetical protein
MPLQHDGQAPYAPTPTVLSVIRRYREHNMTTPFTADVLRKAGVTESLTKRTLNSLVLLDLIEENGEPTDALKALSKARPDEYQTQFANLLQGVYASVFSFVDPAKATSEEIRNAFWGFQPKGQIDNMVRLFFGLCEEAGLVEARPSSTRKNSAAKVARPVAKQPFLAKRTGDGTNSVDTQPQSPKLGDARQRYVDMLLAKALEQAEPDPALLDRIERAIGIAPAPEVPTS